MHWVASTAYLQEGSAQPYPKQSEWCHTAVIQVMFYEQGNTNKTRGWGRWQSLKHIFLPAAMKGILSSRMKQNKSGSQSNVLGIQLTAYRCAAKITNYFTDCLQRIRLVCN